MLVALVIVCTAVLLLVVGTVVMAWRLGHRAPSREPPPTPEDSEHSVGDHVSLPVYREHLV